MTYMFAISSKEYKIHLSEKFKTTSQFKADFRHKWGATANNFSYFDLLKTLNCVKSYPAIKEVLELFNNSL